MLLATFPPNASGALVSFPNTKLQTWSCPTWSQAGMSADLSFSATPCILQTAIWIIFLGAPNSTFLGSTSLGGPRPNWKPIGSISRFGHLMGLTNSIPTKPWNQSYIRVPLKTWGNWSSPNCWWKAAGLFLKKFNSYLLMNQSFHS